MHQINVARPWNPFNNKEGVYLPLQGERRIAAAVKGKGTKQGLLSSINLINPITRLPIVLRSLSHRLSPAARHYPGHKCSKNGWTRRHVYLAPHRFLFLFCDAQEVPELESTPFTTLLRRPLGGVTLKREIDWIAGSLQTTKNLQVGYDLVL